MVNTITFNSIDYATMYSKPALLFQRFNEWLKNHSTVKILSKKELCNTDYCVKVEIKYID